VRLPGLGDFRGGNIDILSAGAVRRDTLAVVSLICAAWRTLRARFAPRGMVAALSRQSKGWSRSMYPEVHFLSSRSGFYQSNGPLDRIGLGFG
jgi:hypothetical protein